MERKAISLQVESETQGHYFTTVNKECHEFIHSGSTLLNCVLGGGWPLGRMSNIVGDASTGKCVKNGYILSKEGMKDISSFSYGEEGFKPMTLGLGVSQNRSVITDHFYEETATELVKVSTAAGFSIEGTLSHPILVWTKDCETVMKQLSSIKEGDIAIISVAPQFFTDKLFDLSVYHESVRFDSAQCKNITLPTDLTPELAQVFGYIVADGVLVKNAESICISNKSNRQWLTESANSALESYGLKLSKNNWIMSKRFYDLIFMAFGSPEIFTARHKYVPDCILQSPAHVQAAFLRGLIDCDGWFNGSTYLDYYTASEQLANQVQLMLLNFGIFSTKSSKDHASIGEVFYDHTYWTLRIPYKYCIVYADLIGSEKYNFSYLNCSKIYCQQIPFLLKKMKNDVDSFKKSLNWSKNGKLSDGKVFPNFRPFCNCCRSVDSNFSTLSKFIETFTEYSHLFDLQWYKDLESSGFYFDTVVKVEKKNYEQAIPVYDVHVPEHHTFWCNGFISHNSLLCIEAAANFHHQFPNGKIIYLEAEAAFDESYAEALGMPVTSVNFVGEDLEDFTVESWFEHLTETIEALSKEDVPCLYIVDSLDALSDRAEKGREIDKGSYGASKPKIVGQLFRRLTKEIEKTQIHLMIVSQVRDNIGVCFGYDSNVWLADGTTEKIGKIVNQKMDVEVLSFNMETDKIEPKKVIDWHDNGPSDDFLIIKITGGSSSDRTLTVTPDHLIFTPTGEKRAGDLAVGDKVLALGETHFTEDQHQLILGSLLGDGSLRRESADRANLRFGHGKNQISYCEWKASAMNCKMKIMKNGIPWADTLRSEDFKRYYDLHQKSERTSVPQKYVDMLTTKSVAVWYMDDGTFKGESTKHWGHGSCQICSKCLDYDSLFRISEKLQKLDLGKPTIKVGKGLFWYGKESEKFQMGIARYVHPNLRYKLKAGRPEFDWIVEQKQSELCVVESTVRSIKQRENSIYTKRGRYDISVEDNHNYIVSGVIVHNCFGEKHYRTGGKAMDFYASQILWLAQIKKLDKTIKKQKRVYGVQIKAKCKKNKIGLPFRECEFPIVFGYGVDDITSMLTWLESIDDKTISSTLAGLFTDFTYKGIAELAELLKALDVNKREELIQKLAQLVIESWQDIETRFIPKVSKY